MTTKQIPRSACMLQAGQVTLSDNGEGAKSYKIRMLARSAQPIDHWYWGKVVHDISGVHMHKDRLTLDYCHDDNQVLGYLNHFTQAEAGLECTGALTPWRDDDRASEVAFKMGQGVPYEASIFFGGDGLKIQQVAEGELTEVNGYQFEGPGMVIRSWPLRGVAICPYGADMNTDTTQLSGDSCEFTAEMIEGGAEMADEITGTVEAAEPVAEVTQLSVDAAETEAVEAAVEVTETAAEETTAELSAPESEGASVPVVPVAELSELAQEFGADIALQAVLNGTGRVGALQAALDATRAENEQLKQFAQAGGTAAAFVPAIENDGKPKRIADLFRKK